MKPIFRVLSLIFLQSFAASSDEIKTIIFQIVPPEAGKTTEAKTPDQNPPIQITIRNATPSDAQAIVDAVTKLYADHSKVDQPLKTLDEQIIAQSDLVQEHRKKLTVIDGGHIFNNGHKNPLGTTEAEMLKNARMKLADFKVSRDQTESQIKTLVKLTDEQLIVYAAGLDLPENQVDYYYTQYREAKNERLLLIAQGLGAVHPKLVAMDNRFKNLMDEANKEVVSLKANLKTKLELTNRQVERMAEMVNVRKNDTIELSLIERQYDQAKEAYEKARLKLNELNKQKAQADLKKKEKATRS